MALHVGIHPGIKPPNIPITSTEQQDHHFNQFSRMALDLDSSHIVSRYCGPLEILERIGSVAYMLSLHASMGIKNVFHVSFLKKYVPDANHVNDWTVIQVEHEGKF
jgi:hypothetical protein